VSGAIETELKAQALPWMAPISEAAPAGRSARNTPAYEKVTSEVAKLESPAAGAVDWKLVVEEGGKLLQQESKDLLIAAYFSYGLVATRGLPGLGSGLSLLSGLLEDYWPTLFPELVRLRGRVNAIAWFVQRASTMVSAYEPRETDRVALEQAAAAFAVFGRLVRERFADAGPAMGALSEAIQRAQMSLPEEVAAAASSGSGALAGGASASPAAASSGSGAAQNAGGASAAGGSPGTGAAQNAGGAPATGAQNGAGSAAPAVILPTAPSVSGDLSSPEAVVSQLRALGSAVVSAAAAIRSALPDEPASYRLLRAGTWMHLDALVSQSGKTGIPAPQKRDREQLERLLSSSSWGELLEQSEVRVSQTPFWLDLQWFSARALEGLGRARARQALIAELSAMLKRISGVAELRFSDGTPFASQATSQWLQTEVLSVPPAPAAASEGPSFAEALAVAAKGELSAALSQLDTALRAAPDERSRFQVRLAQAQACVAARQPAMARALFQRLDADVQSRQLEAWEPSLAARVLEGLLSLPSRQNDAAEIEKLYARLCAIDPNTALRVGPPSTNTARS
jgi:type VI secretion system protein VasJ